MLQTLLVLPVCPKMLYICVSLFLAIQPVFGNTIYTAKFHTTQAHNLGNKGIRCATLMRTVSRIAAKLHGTSGECEGLTWQWGENKEYMTDYAYIEKKVITEIYTPPMACRAITAFLLPFNVSNGGEIEISFTIHNDTNNIFNVDLVNTLDEHYIIDDAVLEEFPMRLKFKRNAEFVQVKSGYGAITEHDIFSPLVISFGVPHKLNVKTLASSIKVWFDDVQLFHYTPTVCPACAKLLRLRDTSNATIHHITFKAA